MLYLVNPPESQEQRILAKWLDSVGALWCHVPNGGKRDAIAGSRLKAQGVKAGVPDVLVFSLPAAYKISEQKHQGKDCRETPRGVAIELKRCRGGVVSKAQREWLDRLGECGWVVYVAKGATDAIKKLKELGYG